jgi:hypothetical protein
MVSPPLMSGVGQGEPFDPVILVEVDVTLQVMFQNTVEAFSLTSFCEWYAVLISLEILRAAGPPTKWNLDLTYS